MQQQEGTLNSLPDEILLHIFHSLDDESVLGLPRVCQLWNRLVSSFLPPVSSEFTLSKSDLKEYFALTARESTKQEHDKLLLKLQEGLHTNLRTGLSLRDNFQHRAAVFGQNEMFPNIIHGSIGPYPVTVIRGGKRFRIPSSSVVVGDLLLLDARDRSCADGFLVEGDILVYEAPVNGESLSREIDSTATCRRTIWAGTQCNGGRCTVLVGAVGQQTQYYQISSRKIDSYARVVKYVPPEGFSFGYSHVEEDGYAEYLSWKHTKKPKFNKQVFIDADSMIAEYKVEHVEINGHIFNSLEDFLSRRDSVLSSSLLFLLDSVLTLHHSAFYQPFKKDKPVGGTNKFERALLSLVPKERAKDLWDLSEFIMTTLDMLKVPPSILTQAGIGYPEGYFESSNTFADFHKMVLDSFKVDELETTKKGLVATELSVRCGEESDPDRILYGLVGLRPILKKNCAATIQRLMTSKDLPYEFHLLSTNLHSPIFLEHFADQIFEGKRHSLTTVTRKGANSDPKLWALVIGPEELHHVKNSPKSIQFFQDKTNEVFYHWSSIMILEDDWKFVEEIFFGRKWEKKKGPGCCIC